jgi:hypothetical protein
VESKGDCLETRSPGGPENPKKKAPNKNTLPSPRLDLSVPPGGQGKGGSNGREGRGPAAAGQGKAGARRLVSLYEALLNCS